jgi:MFS transporter, DHA3 family, macrolide efflux protein
MKQDLAAEQRAASHGMQTFLLIWFGQLISIFGTGLTGFGVGVWVYDQTGSATHLTLMAFFTMLPMILIAPIAGVLVDRWNRKWTLVLGDLGGALFTLVLALLLWTDNMTVWALYPIVIMSAVFGAFQFPAFTAAISQIVPKEQFGRASGMMQLAQAVSQLVAPVLAGVLLGPIGLEGIALIDFVTCLFAVTTLLLIRIPNPQVSAEGAASRSSVLGETAFGWKYIVTRPGLLGLLLFFAASNFMMGAIIVLSTPLVLSFASAATLGIVRSVAGLGLLFGSVLMSVWRGPRRKVYGVLTGVLLSGVSMLIAGLAPSALLISIAAFFFALGMPLVSASSQPIWQSKVPVDVQGRVFGVRMMIATAAMPLSYLISGPLVDFVFEPLMAPGGGLASSVGRLIGSGEGRGIGLLFVILGVLSTIAVVLGYLYPRLRLVEDELPDAIPDNLPAAAQPPQSEPQPQLQHL